MSDATILAATLGTFIATTLLLLRYTGGIARGRTTDHISVVEACAIGLVLWGGVVGIFVALLFWMPENGAVSRPMTATALVGWLAPFASIGRVRKAIASVLILGGGSQVLLTVLAAALDDQWVTGGAAQLWDSNAFGLTVIAWPGITSLVAGLLLRSKLSDPRTGLALDSTRPPAPGRHTEADQGGFR